MGNPEPFDRRHCQDCQVGLWRKQQEKIRPTRTCFFFLFRYFCLLLFFILIVWTWCQLIQLMSAEYLYTPQCRPHSPSDRSATHFWKVNFHFLHLLPSVLSSEPLIWYLLFLIWVLLICFIIPPQLYFFFNFIMCSPVSSWPALELLPGLLLVLPKLSSRIMILDFSHCA